MELFSNLLSSVSFEDGLSKIYSFFLENYNLNILRFYIVSDNTFLSPIFVRGGDNLGRLSLTENSLIVDSYLNNQVKVLRENDEEYVKNKFFKLKGIKFFISVPFSQQGIITLESNINNNFSYDQLVEIINNVKISCHILLNIFFKKIILEKEIEEYSKKIATEMEKSNKLTTLGKLTSSIVHEIKNPLTTINVLINQLLQENSQSSIVSDLRVIKDEVERINRLLKEFLLFAKPKEPKKEIIDVKSFLDEVKIIVGPYLTQNNIEIIFKIKRPTIFVDKDQLKQIFLNLILNSIEAVKENGFIKVSVESKVYSEKEYSLITIEDSGPGIDEDKIPYIFEPFFSESNKGTGLGLSIVNRLVQNNGGFIEFYNLLHGGACFNIYFPLT